MVVAYDFCTSPEAVRGLKSPLRTSFNEPGHEVKCEPHPRAPRLKHGWRDARDSLAIAVDGNREEVSHLLPRDSSSTCTGNHLLVEVGYGNLGDIERFSSECGLHCRSRSSCLVGLLPGASGVPGPSIGHLQKCRIQAEEIRHGFQQRCLGGGALDSS